MVYVEIVLRKDLQKESYKNEAAPLEGEAGSLKLLANARARYRRVGCSGSFGYTFFIADNQPFD